MYDTDDSGYLDRSELKEALTAMFVLYNSKGSEKAIEKLLDEWSSELFNKYGKITKSNLNNIF